MLCWIADTHLFLFALLPGIDNAYIISTAFVVVVKDKSVLAASWQMQACWLQIGRFLLYVLAVILTCILFNGTSQDILKS